MRQGKRNSAPRYKGFFKLRIWFLLRFSKWFAGQIFNNLHALMRCACNDSSADYTYARYILSIVEDKKFTDECVKEITRWIVESGNDALLPTLSDIYTCLHTVYIRTIRPGLWIGKGGETIDSLISHLRKMCPDINVELVENTRSLSKVYSHYTHY
jgi:hypothetical protein